MIAASLKDRNVIQLTADLLAGFPEVGDALQLAAYAHDGQERKEVRDGADHRDPYVIHPIRMALRIARWGMFDNSRPALLIAMRSALLHDVPEDAAYRMLDYLELSPATNPFTALGLVFDPQVADAVSRVTNPASLDELSFDKKIDAYHEHIIEKVVGNLFPLLVKAADMVDNAGSLKHMAPCEKRFDLARKYMEPSITLADSLEHMATSPNLPMGIATDYEFVRGMTRAASRVHQITGELGEILTEWELRA